MEPNSTKVCKHLVSGEGSKGLEKKVLGLTEATD